MKPRFLRLSYFAWIIVPVGAWMALQAHGLPHLIWSYSYHGGSYADFAGGRYVRCTFIGPYGAFTTHPTDGNCPWFLFRTAGGGQ